MTEAPMTQYETINVVISGFAVFLSCAIVALMWWGIREMARANRDRAAQAAEDRKAILAALERQGAALERQGAALGEIIRRTAAR